MGCPFGAIDLELATGDEPIESTPETQVFQVYGPLIRRHLCG